MSVWTLVSKEVSGAPLRLEGPAGNDFSFLLRVTVAIARSLELTLAVVAGLLVRFNYVGFILYETDSGSRRYSIQLPKFPGENPAGQSGWHLWQSALDRISHFHKVLAYKIECRESTKLLYTILEIW